MSILKKTNKSLNSELKDIRIPGIQSENSGTRRADMNDGQHYSNFLEILAKVFDFSFYEFKLFQGLC